MSKGAGSGDKLARGAVSARFMTTEGGVSQEKWDSMFTGRHQPVKKAEYILKCSVHGHFASGKEFFLSGGYPQGPDEYKTGKCLKEECDEIAVYGGYQPVEMVINDEQRSGDANSAPSGVPGTDVKESALLSDSD